MGEMIARTIAMLVFAGVGGFLVFGTFTIAAMGLGFAGRIGRADAVMMAVYFAFAVGFFWLAYTIAPFTVQFG